MRGGGGPHAMLEVFWGAPRRRWVLSVAWPKFRSAGRTSWRALGGALPKLLGALADVERQCSKLASAAAEKFDLKSKRAVPPLAANRCNVSSGEIGPLAPHQSPRPRRRGRRRQPTSLRRRIHVSSSARLSLALLQSSALSTNGISIKPEL